MPSLSCCCVLRINFTDAIGRIFVWCCTKNSSFWKGTQTAEILYIQMDATWYKGTTFSSTNCIFVCFFMLFIKQWKNNNCLLIGNYKYFETLIWIYRITPKYTKVLRKCKFFDKFCLHAIYSVFFVYIWFRISYRDG